MPVMLCGFIPEDEWLVLAELSYFFCVLCAKELLLGLFKRTIALCKRNGTVGAGVDLQVREDISAGLL